MASKQRNGSSRNATSRRRRPHPLLYVAVALLAAAALAWASGVRFTLTPSLPVGFYLRTEPVQERGRLLSFCPPKDAAAYALERGYLHRGSCPGGTEPLGKYVLATTGDTVGIQPGGLSVNGRPIPNSAVLWRDRLGRELPHTAFGQHVVGADSLFMFSPHHKRSFDSRYFGAIDRRRVRSGLRPLWTF